MGMATELLAADEVPLGVWEDVLFTVVRQVPSMLYSVGVEYLAALTDSGAVPDGWIDSVAANGHLLCREFDVAAKHGALPSTAATPTVDPDSLTVSQRTKEYRDSSFSTMVRDDWDHRCAVCQCQFHAPYGNSGLETAHIYPVRLGGPDRAGNVLALCTLHHWAFDSGWLTVTDSYTVRLRDSIPHEIAAQLAVEDGDDLLIPDGYDPEPEYLGLHRRLYDFELFEAGDRFPLSLDPEDALSLTGEADGATIRVRLPAEQTVHVPLSRIDTDGAAINLVAVTDVDRDRGVLTATPISH